VHRPQWQAFAACRDEPVDTFFVEGAGPGPEPAKSLRYGQPALSLMPGNQSGLSFAREIIDCNQAASHHHHQRPPLDPSPRAVHSAPSSVAA